MSPFDELRAEPWRFDLLATLRRLEREHPHRPRIGDNDTLAEEFVSIVQNPYLEFPASNLDAAEREASGRIRLTARFLGMFGPQGALPLSTTEEAYAWLLERDDAFARFADIFQRRFLALFFRAWGDARPIVQNDRPGQDRFVAYIGSMIGVGAPAFRERDSLSDFSKMEYAGLLAPRVKSASRLRSLLSGLLKTRVEVEEFVGSWLLLATDERTRLGATQSRLGVDCVAGASLFTVGDRIRVRVFSRDLDHYRQFGPGGDLARQVADAVFLYIGREYDWDVELAIPAGKIAPIRLGDGARLGWTSWMAPNWSNTDETLRKDAHFHLASRTANGANSEAAN